MIRETHFNRFNKGKAIIRDYKDGITQCYLINTKGELVYKFEPNVWADSIEDDNVIFVRKEINEKFDAEALFDTNGRQLTDFKYRAILGGIEEGFFEVRNLENKHGHITITGEEAIPCIYDDGNYFEEGVSAEKLHNKWGMINCKNEIVIPFEYEEIWGCNNNRISAKLNGKWGVIDKFNNKIIDLKYDEICIYLTRDSGTIPAKIGDKWGIIDIYGNTLFDFCFDDCEDLDEKGWYKFKQNGKWAIYNCEKNSFICDFVYDEVDLYYPSGICRVKSNGKYDFIDKENAAISDFSYDNVQHFYRTNLIAINKNGKTGLMNTGGKILIPPKYKDKIKHASENMLVWESDKFNQYVTDINMNIIIKKQKYQQFYGGYNSGMIAEEDGYYNKTGEKLELKFEL